VTAGPAKTNWLLMPATVKLSQLAIGSRATVCGFPGQGPAFLRLREMGVLPGTTVTLVRTAPLGDPLEIQVRGYSLTLRKSDAEHVVVEPTVGS
jgi:ferrous iron transport protein A